jgi:RINT-1 / TIP-1 family
MQVFLEVYSELIERVKADKSVAPYTPSDLATKLSSSISRGVDDGTLFDIPMQQFHTLKEKSISLIQAHLKKEIFEEFRQYTNLSTPSPTGILTHRHYWGQIGNSDSEEFSYTTTTNSRELLKALPLITAMFGFLHKTLSRYLFMRIFRRFSTELEAYFWEWIVTAHRFTAPGGILFARDMYALWDACGKFISRPEQYAKRLHDAVVLLSLPSSVGVVPVGGEITLATVVKRLRDTDETDVVQTTEMRNWLAENLEVKSLGLEEVLYMYHP